MRATDDYSHRQGIQMQTKDVSSEESDPSCNHAETSDIGLSIPYFSVSETLDITPLIHEVLPQSEFLDTTPCIQEVKTPNVSISSTTESPHSSLIPAQTF